MQLEHVMHCCIPMCVAADHISAAHNLVATLRADAAKPRAGAGGRRPAALGKKLKDLLEWLKVRAQP